MARSPLVADISPLIQSLQRFTPRAREDRELQLAGIARQGALQEENLITAQRANRQAQITAVANENRSALIEDKNDIAFVLKDGPEGLRNNLAQLAGQKGEDSPDMAELVEFANMAVTDPDGAFAKLTKNQENVNLQLTTIDEILTRTSGRKGKFIGTPVRVERDGKTFLTGIQQKPDGSFGRVDVPIEGELVSTLGETAQEQATTKITTAGGVERAKIRAKIKLEPELRRVVKKAEAEAKARGETFTDLLRAEAALPGLLDTVSQLKELAPIATSTFGGRVFDAAVKETGFGSTKGANARAKFIALINNQVLPLLKPTFGAAFTEGEGEALKATMGDPDATPEQKILQLESFIDQKVKGIQGLQRELGEGVTPAAELAPSDLSTMTVEQLIELRSQVTQ